MKQPIATASAPEAIGPYSQGIKAGGFLYVSGQLPMRPDGYIERDDVKAAARICLGNIEAILKAGGGSLEDVVKTTIFLTDLNDFVAVNDAYGAFFVCPPARSTVQAAALPKGACVEIEAVAYIE